MKVLLVNDLIPPDYEGGLELSALQTAQALRSLGHQVDVVTSEYRESFAGDRVAQEGVFRVLRFVETRPAQVGGQAQKLEDVRKLVARINAAATNEPILGRFIDEYGPYDVAFLFGFYFVGLGTAMAVQKRGIPTVWSIADEFIPTQRKVSAGGRLFGLATSTVAREWRRKELNVRVEHAVFISDYLRRVYEREGLLPGRWAVVPRAIAFEPVSQIDERPPCFFLASRIDEIKGVHVAIEAARLLAVRRPELEWRFEFAGKAREEYLARLLAQIESAGLSSRVSYVGMLSPEGVLARMRSVRAFVNPALWEEPFGRSNIEAVACGALLIASESGAIREIVGAPPCALLYDRTDAEALSRHMESALCDRSTWSDLTVKALTRVQRFRMSTVAVELETQLRRASLSSS